MLLPSTTKSLDSSIGDATRDPQPDHGAAPPIYSPSAFTCPSRLPKMKVRTAPKSSVMMGRSKPAATSGAGGQRGAGWGFEGWGPLTLCEEIVKFHIRMRTMRYLPWTTSTMSHRKSASILNLDASNELYGGKAASRQHSGADEDIICADTRRRAQARAQCMSIRLKVTCVKARAGDAPVVGASQPACDLPPEAAIAASLQTS